ncbi:unnamed protein product [Polarella glacialis]|uniref:Uncharacterized protein n=1 Tax=Polarella glacialis TaxID=89957 RepID=A0A813HM67_POLGL|nr:unnamed protein product [Polarella glacialis]
MRGLLLTRPRISVAIALSCYVVVVVIAVAVVVAVYPFSSLSFFFKGFSACLDGSGACVDEFVPPDAERHPAVGPFTDRENLLVSAKGYQQLDVCFAIVVC